MTGQRRLHRDFRCLTVTNLTDHNNVRVLPQDRTQAVGKGQIDFRIHLDLADTGQLVFDRVLNRDDILFTIVQAGQRRIQAGGLTGTGRSGHQEDAMTFADHPLELTQQLLLQADLFEGEDPGRLVKQAQHDAFTKRCR